MSAPDLTMTPIPPPAPPADPLPAIARTYWLLTCEARSIVAELQREHAEIAQDIIALRLHLAIAAARPRSRLVSWHLPDDVVAPIIERVAAAVATEAQP